ncbi:MAG: hypothetical protein NTU47_14085 [Ignavibacteriales bacterium]|nr:hypothetical protein [Ignavibacteriales bacterium]
MNNNTLKPHTLVFGNEIDRCPDCRHVWTDDAECHYNDCRYFSLDQEMEVEEDGFVFQFSTAKLPATNFAA